MVPEGVLECRGCLRKAWPGLTGDGCGGLGSITRALGEDADSVEVSVGSLLGQALHALAKPFPVAPSQRRYGGRRRSWCLRVLITRPHGIRPSPATMAECMSYAVSRTRRALRPSPFT